MSSMLNGFCAVFFQAGYIDISAVDLYSKLGIKEEVLYFLYHFEPHNLLCSGNLTKSQECGWRHNLGLYQHAVQVGVR